MEKPIIEQPRKEAYHVSLLVKHEQLRDLTAGQPKYSEKDRGEGPA